MASVYICSQHSVRIRYVINSHVFPPHREVECDCVQQSAFTISTASEQYIGGKKGGESGGEGDKGGDGGGEGRGRDGGCGGGGDGEYKNAFKL